MWAGETRAFKFIRLLIKQGIKGIKYEEGPLISYNISNMVRECKDVHIDPYRYYEYRYLIEQIHDMVKDTTAPRWFKVSF